MARKVGDVGTAADGTKFIWKKSKGSNALSRDFSAAAVKRASGGAKPKVVRKTSTNKPKVKNTNTNTSSSNSAGPVRPRLRPTGTGSAAPVSSIRPRLRPTGTGSAAPVSTIRPKARPRVKASGVGNYSSANSAGTRTSTRSSTAPSVKSGQRGTKADSRPSVKSGQRGKTATNTKSRHSYDEVPKSRNAKTSTVKRVTKASTDKRNAEADRIAKRRLNSMKDKDGPWRAKTLHERVDKNNNGTTSDEAKSYLKYLDREDESKRSVARRKDSLEGTRVVNPKPKRVVTKKQKEAEANNAVSRRKRSLQGEKASRIPKKIDARFPGARRLEKLMDFTIDQNDKAYKSWSKRLAQAKKEYRAWAIKRNKR